MNWFLEPEVFQGDSVVNAEIIEKWHASGILKGLTPETAANCIAALETQRTLYDRNEKTEDPDFWKRIDIPIIRRLFIRLPNLKSHAEKWVATGIALISEPEMDKIKEKYAYGLAAELDVADKIIEEIIQFIQSHPKYNGLSCMKLEGRQLLLYLGEKEFN